MSEILDLRVGPVPVAPGVEPNFGEPQVSHRDPVFVDEYLQVRKTLAQLFKCREAFLLVGTGTLANDVICAQIAVAGGNGLIVSNGEFGERLIDHAQRFGARFSILRKPWGRPIRLTDIEREFSGQAIEWLWMVHIETSSGVMAPIGEISKLCRERGVRFYVDCASSLGNVAFDLSGVSMAAGGTNKGLRVPAGLAVILSNEKLAHSQRIPRYLDLALYEKKEPPFTSSTRLVHALAIALRTISLDSYCRKLREDTLWARRQLRVAGLKVVGPDRFLAPGIISIALEPKDRSSSVADFLRNEGILVSWQSDYLCARNWIQCSLMGRPGRDELRSFVSQLVTALKRD